MAIDLFPYYLVSLKRGKTGTEKFKEVIFPYYLVSLKHEDGECLDYDFN